MNLRKMQYPKLELQITQIERLIADSRNKFSDKKKTEIYFNLLLLFKNIKNSDYLSFNSQDLFYTRLALDIVFYGVEFLDYKNENEIPKKLIFCLNKVLDEWITNGTDNYFIVVSYNRTSDNFFIRAYDQGQLTGLKLLFKSLFNIEYSQSLIQISKPKFLADDYLSCIPLYHELGHFVDKNYQITFNFSREPIFASYGISEIHFSEFFADLFAAQYIGKSAVAPLDETKTNSAPTHPSNAKRVEVVNTFVAGTGSPECMNIVNELKRVALLRTGRELKIRHENLTDEENPFITLTPKVFSGPQKLHSLFNCGWQSWLDSKSVIRINYPIHGDCSTIINKLIRNSIKLTMQQGEVNRLKKVGNYLGNIAAKFGFIDN